VAIVHWGDVHMAGKKGRPLPCCRDRGCAELAAEFDHPDIGPIRQPKPASRFDRTPAVIRGPAPCIGEHSAVILAELRLDAAEIERLAAEKIVRLVKTWPLPVWVTPLQ
jgi:hypothetical protein